MRNRKRTTTPTHNSPLAGATSARKARTGRMNSRISARRWGHRDHPGREKPRKKLAAERAYGAHGPSGWSPKVLVSSNSVFRVPIASTEKTGVQKKGLGHWQGGVYGHWQGVLFRLCVSFFSRVLVSCGVLSTRWAFGLSPDQRPSAIIIPTPGRARWPPGV